MTMANSRKVAVKPLKSVVSKSRPAAIKESSADSKKRAGVPKKISGPSLKKITREPKPNGKALLVPLTPLEKEKPLTSKLKSAIKKLVKPITGLLPGASDDQGSTQRPATAILTDKRVQQEARTRYNDSELEEFKQLIVDKLEAARRELKYLQDQINRRGDNGTDDTENKFASSDDGSSSMEREYLNQMAARQIMYMDHLDKALVRIRNKTYGICRVTGKLIDKDRLKAVPHATLSMEAKRIQSHS